MSYSIRVSSVLFAIVLACGVFSGCRDRDYHDPYYHDNHPRASEQPYYNHWEQETHREHKELNQRSQAEQKQYWDWRHRQH